MPHFLLLHLFRKVCRVQFASRFTPFEGMWADLFTVQNAAGDSMRFRGKVRRQALMLTMLFANSLTNSVFSKELTD